MSPKHPAEGRQQVPIGKASRVGKEGRIASGLLFPRETNTRTRARLAGQPRILLSLSELLAAYSFPRNIHFLPEPKNMFHRLLRQMLKELGF